jgi:hypothetical protein
VLVAHIYLVARPGHKKEQQRVMPRIDFKQDIAPDDAEKITDWLYKQKGVDHVLCNDWLIIQLFNQLHLIRLSQDWLVFLRNRYLAPL